MGHTVRTLHTRATSGASGLWQTYRQWRYTILFCSLLITFVVGPLDSALGLRTNLLNLFLAINLLAAVAPIRGRKTRLVLLCILVVALVGRGIMAWLDQAALVPLDLALWTALEHRGHSRPRLREDRLRWESKRALLAVFPLAQG
jgi:hypothetical protein